MIEIGDRFVNSWVVRHRSGSTSLDLLGDINVPDCGIAIGQMAHFTASVALLRIASARSLVLSQTTAV
jgi:hypothetical protein